VERVTGIGGVFLRAQDADALAAWYARHLGIPLDTGQTYGAFAANHPNPVWSTFAHDTDYWPADRQAMVNYTVSDLDALLEQLREAGVEVDDRVETLEGIGRFGWASDPEGNRFELWEPADG
jgi:predicted enzyme related to lactoylglutathione lyase